MVKQDLMDIVQRYIERLPIMKDKKHKDGTVSYERILDLFVKKDSSISLNDQKSLLRSYIDGRIDDSLVINENRYPPTVSRVDALSCFINRFEVLKDIYPGLAAVVEINALGYINNGTFPSGHKSSNWKVSNKDSSHSESSVQTAGSTAPEKIKEIQGSVCEWRNTADSSAKAVMPKKKEVSMPKPIYAKPDRAVNDTPLPMYSKDEALSLIADTGYSSETAEAILARQLYSDIIKKLYSQNRINDLVARLRMNAELINNSAKPHWTSMKISFEEYKKRIDDLGVFERITSGSSDVASMQNLNYSRKTAGLKLYLEFRSTLGKKEYQEVFQAICPKADTSAALRSYYIGLTAASHEALMDPVLTLEQFNSKYARRLGIKPEVPVELIEGVPFHVYMILNEMAHGVNQYYTSALQKNVIRVKNILEARQKRVA